MTDMERHRNGNGSGEADAYAAVLHGKNQLELARLPSNKIPRADDLSPYDALIEVMSVGICGSDVHYWTHGEIGPFKVEKPMILGHETAGKVAAVGSSVRDLKVGDRVAVEVGIPCRRCIQCKSGRYNLCPDMKFAATPPYVYIYCHYHYPSFGSRVTCHSPTFTI
jgi:L-iditol 2-dehydrogenase